MADVEKILRLVAEGALTPDEADEILAATARPRGDADASAASPGTARHLRVEVSDGGERVVNLRVPMNVAGWATSFLPGLAGDAAERIRAAVSSGVRGPILDINSEDGSRVLIVSE